jgi:hypothetical protein
VLVDRLRWDRRRHPHHGHREYSQAARGVAAVAEKTLTVGDQVQVQALVPVLRKAVDRVTRALAYLDDSSGVIGQNLRDLVSLYARACCAAPPSPAWRPGWWHWSGTAPAGRRSSSPTSRLRWAPRV